MQPALAVAVRDPAAPQPAVPTRIGRFLVHEEIGRGSNGVVYAASDPVLGRDVAIKAIPLDPANPAQRGVEAGFLEEAKIAAGLNHPSIVTVFDAGRTDTIAYIAMERLYGADLHHWLNTNHTMSPESAAALIARVADAVHFAHRRGLIHRDIKPSNIFLGRDLKPKVLDFGIALAQGKQPDSDEAPKLIGTPNYMSPEQALGLPLDARSDVFSIGSILYELITGRRAFDGANVDEILTKVVKSDPPPLDDRRPDVSPLIGEIVFRALAKNPASRYQTAAQLRNDLAAFAGRPVAPATSPTAEFAVNLPRPGLNLPARGPLIATGAAVLGLSLTFAFWFWSHRIDADGAALAPAATANVAPAPLAPPAPPPPPAESAASPKPGKSAADTGAADVDDAAAAAAVHPPGARAAHKTAPKPPAPAPEPAPPEPGALALAIAPWGQVLVDGADMGVSPPLNHLSLAPGTHVVEVRNGSAPAFRAQVEVEAGKTLFVQHRF